MTAGLSLPAADKFILAKKIADISADDFFCLKLISLRLFSKGKVVADFETFL